MITKKAARAVADRASRHGHFKTSEEEAWVECPYCRNRVTAYKRVTERNFTLAMWQAAFIDHLEQCGPYRNKPEGSLPP